MVYRAQLDSKNAQSDAYDLLASLGSGVSINPSGKIGGRRIGILLLEGELVGAIGSNYVRVDEDVAVPLIVHRTLKQINWQRISKPYRTSDLFFRQNRQT
jgi:hypothetical protein